MRLIQFSLFNRCSLLVLIVETIKTRNYFIPLFFIPGTSVVQFIKSVQIYVKPSHHDISHDTTYFHRDGGHNLEKINHKILERIFCFVCSLFFAPGVLMLQPMKTVQIYV